MSDQQESADRRLIEYLEAVLDAAKLGQVRTYSISESRGNTPYIGNLPVEVTLSAYLGSKTVHLKSELLIDESQKLYAFWEDSGFPYVCGGEVGRFTAEGLAYIPSFQGSFRPVLLLPLEEGKKLKERLKEKGSWRRSAQHKLEHDALEDLKKAFPELKKVLDAKRL